MNYDEGKPFANQHERRTAERIQTALDEMHSRRKEVQDRRAMGSVAEEDKLLFGAAVLSVFDELRPFRERVEEIRKRREQEREEGEGGERPDPEEMMGGGGSGGMGGGNPFAQMMGGMMGGGGPGGAPGGMGGGPGGAPGEAGPGGESGPGNEELVREVRQLRDEVRDATRQLQRIAQALEDD